MGESILGSILFGARMEEERVNYEEFARRAEASLKGEAGRKFDVDKLRYDLLPAKAVAEVVAILTLGARKYAPDNWKKVLDGEDGVARYIAAEMRHFEAWRAGEKDDPESGRSHLAHAICCLLFLLEGEVG